ncbi:unnamed protein product [Closterium sp. NIES-64]|nr:unnamed protein product [Closterium sp. NIES-64]CAI6008213.1 unnamed protein product [Closterium sp. NIES-65]
MARSRAFSNVARRLALGFTNSQRFSAPPSLPQLVSHAGSATLVTPQLHFANDSHARLHTHSSPALPIVSPKPTTSASLLSHNPAARVQPPLLSHPPLSRGFAGILVELGLVPPPPDHGEEEARKKEVIKAVLRPGSGKIQAKKERRLGRIPSIVFEQEDGHLGGRKRLVSVDRKQIGRLVKKFGRPFFVSQVFNLEIAAEGAEAAEGEAAGAEGVPEESTVESVRMRVIPKLVHWHGATDEILNVTFLKLPERESARVKVPVPLVFVGEDACPGIKKGGWLYTMRRTLPFSCPPSAIPPFVEVDLSALDVGHKITLADVARQVDPRLRLLLADVSHPVCKIAGSRSLAKEAAPA